MRRKYLKAKEVLELYKLHLMGKGVREVGMAVGTSYSATFNWIRDINLSLQGHPVERQKGQAELIGGVILIRKYLASMTTTPAPVQETLPTQVGGEVAEPAEKKIERLFSELKNALGEYAVELAESKNKDILEQNRQLLDIAQKSNVVGFIKSRWER